MRRSFLAGLGLGLVLSVAVIAATSRRASEPPRTNLRPRIEAEIPDEKPPSADAPIEQDAAYWKRRYEKLLGKIERWEAEGLEPKRTTESEADKRALAKTEENRELNRLMGPIKIGHGLTEDFARELALDPAQRQAMDVLLTAEGPRMYAMLRDLAAESRAVVPAQDGYYLLRAVLGSWRERDENLLQTMVMMEARYGGTQYLEETLGADSATVKVLDRATRIRQETIGAAKQILREDQHARFAKVFAACLNFDGASYYWPENFQIRRSR